jgi:hypothetical protein
VKLPVQPVVKHTYRVTTCLSKLCAAGQHTALLEADLRVVSSGLPIFLGDPLFESGDGYRTSSLTIYVDLQSRLGYAVA